MSKKLMCVDDSATIRKLVKKTIEPAGWEVVEAENGREGLDKLFAELQFFVVDINMPVMDGFTFVENLKATEGYEKKPVVFLTTESSEEKKQRGRSLGVNGWIVKPFEPETLLKILEMLEE